MEGSRIYLDSEVLLLVFKEAKRQLARGGQGHLRGAGLLYDGIPDLCAPGGGV